MVCVTCDITWLQKSHKAWTSCRNYHGWHTAQWKNTFNLVMETALATVHISKPVQLVIFIALKFTRKLLHKLLNFPYDRFSLLLAKARECTQQSQSFCNQWLQGLKEMHEHAFASKEMGHFHKKSSRTFLDFTLQWQNSY